MFALKSIVIYLLEKIKAFTNHLLLYPFGYYMYMLSLINFIHDLSNQTNMGQRLSLICMFVQQILSKTNLLTNLMSISCNILV